MNNFSFFLFGVTGNLSQIKVIPALYDLFERGRIPANTPIIGVARKEMSQDDFRRYVWDILHQPNRHHTHEINDEVWNAMSASLRYIQGDFSDKAMYANVARELKRTQTHNAVYYLATYPQLYETIFQNLKTNGLTDQTLGWKRLMIEKPIGIDLPSAKSLNTLLANYFEDSQVYRLDHYLGKETLQNILTFRFGNGLLEPLFNSDHIDHIQITAAEDFGIGRRGQYYDTVGALKDVGQNHILQMLTLVTMDAPAAFTNEAVTKERVKVLEKLIADPNAVVFGQYDGYTGEEFVQPDSEADTYFAFRTFVDTPRFADVPIYVRAGKRMEKTVTEISIVFNASQSRLFTHLDLGSEPNVLTFRIQPNEGIVLRFLSKQPGHGLTLESQAMQFCYRTDRNDLPDAYERLIADAIDGDQTFFNDANEVEAQWRFTDALSQVRSRPFAYPQGSWGPDAADQLLIADGREWLVPSMDVCAM